MIDTPSNEQGVLKTEKMARQVKVIATRPDKLEFYPQNAQCGLSYPPTLTCIL